MTGSLYYWAVVAAITVAFAVVDIAALSRRDMGRPQSAAIAVYVGVWAIVLGLSLPIAPTGSLWWVFPAAMRIAFSAMLAGGTLLAAAFRAEQSVVHHEHQQVPAAAPVRELTDDELRMAEAYDALWQVEDRQRNRDRELRDGARRKTRSRSGHASELSRPHDTVPHIEHGEHENGEEFEEVVQRALRALPVHLRDLMSNVEIVIEDEPTDGRPLLGLYEGVPLSRRNRGYVLVPPDKITIYRGPLERLCGDDADRLESEVKRTVWHEIAHHFGISDERLIEIDRY